MSIEIPRVRRNRDPECEITALYLFQTLRKEALVSNNNKINSAIDRTRLRLLHIESRIFRFRIDYRGTDAYVERRERTYCSIIIIEMNLSEIRFAKVENFSSEILVINIRLSISSTMLSREKLIL